MPKMFALNSDSCAMQISIRSMQRELCRVQCDLHSTGDMTGNLLLGSSTVVTEKHHRSLFLQRYITLLVHCAL